MNFRLALLLRRLLLSVLLLSVAPLLRQLLLSVLLLSVAPLLRRLLLSVMHAPRRHRLGVPAPAKNNVELNILYVLNEWQHKPTVILVSTKTHEEMRYISVAKSLHSTNDRRTDDSMIT